MGSEMRRGWAVEASSAGPPRGSRWAASARTVAASDDELRMRRAAPTTSDPSVAFTQPACEYYMWRIHGAGAMGDIARPPKRARKYF